MKIDVQGMDYKCFNGSKNTIKKNKMAIIFEYEDLFYQNLIIILHCLVIFCKEIDFKSDCSLTNFLILPK